MPPVARIGVGALPRPLAALVLLAACASQPDLAADRAELLRIHEVHHEAHLQRRADLLVATFADSFRSISRGTVEAPTAAMSRARFQAYFDRSTFLAWDDLVPPAVRISPDGHMAYVIVQKEVRVRAADTTADPAVAHTTYAWLEVYEKEGGAWQLVAIASTDRPGTDPVPTED